MDARTCFAPVPSVAFGYKCKVGKKKLGFPRGWQQAHADTCITTLFEKQLTGLALVTGDGSDVLAVDLDVAKQKDVDRNIADGMLLWSDLLKNMVSCQRAHPYKRLVVGEDTSFSVCPGA